jgi:hypothetical protein
MQVFPRGNLPVEVCKILSNVQMYYDSLRLPARDDPINSCTTPFLGPGEVDYEDDSENEDAEEDFTDLFNLLVPPQTAFETPAPSSMRKQGSKGCGFQNLPSFSNSTPAIHILPSSFITSTDSERGRNPSTKGSSHHANTRDKPFVSHLMHLTYDYTKRCLFNPSSNNQTSSSPSTVEANGSVLSILEWSKQKNINLDAEQQLAFQIATAAFVLTYFEGAQTIQSPITLKPNGGSSRGQMRHDFNSEKDNLQRLARLKPNEPLRMFLDGGGGSGKSRVVNEILKYAQDYTSRLQLTFNKRTIIVTAMSGVAATCIGDQ